MNNFPLSGKPLFIHERIKEETNSCHIIDMAEWTARESGCPEQHIPSYAVGMLAAMLSHVNARG